MGGASVKAGVWTEDMPRETLSAAFQDLLLNNGETRTIATKIKQNQGHHPQLNKLVSKAFYLRWEDIEVWSSGKSLKGVAYIEIPNTTVRRLDIAFGPDGELRDFYDTWGRQARKRHHEQRICEQDDIARAVMVKEVGDQMT
eukprot:11387759-Karenia_brevis.AAC.1